MPGAKANAERSDVMKPSKCQRLRTFMTGCGRWLEVRSSADGRRVAGFIAANSMLMVGLVLFFYADPGGMQW